MQFPEKRKGDRLGADHVNDLSKAARAFLDLNVSNQSTFTGHIKGGAATPEHIEGYAIVTNAKESEDGDITNGIYLAKFQSYDAENNRWLADDEEYEVDLRGMSREFQAERALVLLVDDVITVRYDQAAGSLVALDVPRFRRVMSDEDIEFGSEGFASVVQNFTNASNDIESPRVKIRNTSTSDTQTIFEGDTLEVYFDVHFGYWVPYARQAFYDEVEFTILRQGFVLPSTGPGNPAPVEDVVEGSESVDSSLDSVSGADAYVCSVDGVSARGVYVYGVNAGEVTVVDRLGCVFNEDPDDLIGRKGFAKLMRQFDGTISFGAPFWTVTSLCCPPE